MSFVRCPSCCSHIHVTVFYCPKCGKPKPKNGWKKSWNFLCSFAVVAFMLVIMNNIYISVYSP